MSLDSLEVEHRFTFRPEYRAFIERARDIRLAEAPKKVDKSLDWTRRVAEVFSLKEVESEYRNLSSWDARLLRFAYPIARSYSGDAFVQVATGRYAGQVLMTDHETYDGLFDVLASFTSSAVQEEFLNSGTGRALAKLGFAPSFVNADQVIGLALENECDLVAKSLEEFLAALEKTRALAFESREVAAKPTLAWRKVGLLKDATLATTLGDTLIFGGGPSGFHVGRVPKALEQIASPKVDELAAGGGVLWVHDRKTVSWSKDGGRSFTPASLQEKLTILTGLAADSHGQCWVSGFFKMATGRAAEPLVPLEIGKDVNVRKVCGATRHGVAAASGKSGLHLATATGLRPTTLAARASIRYVFETRAGTLIALDDRCHLYRSDDAGATWTTCERPKPAEGSTSVVAAMVCVGRRGRRPRVGLPRRRPDVRAGSRAEVARDDPRRHQSWRPRLFHWRRQRRALGDLSRRP